MFTIKFRMLLPLAVFLAAGVLSAATLTNADIIKMAEAKLDDGIIITAIENSPVNFDTSAQGLIELSGAKVSQPVIAAMLKRGAAVAAPAPAPAPAAAAPAAPAGAASTPAAAAASASDLMSPSEIQMIDGDSMKPMRYLNPQMRTAARGLGFGGVASYAVLRGTAASERTKNRQPSFLVSVPNQAQAESYMTIASFAVRSNNSREVMIGGGFMSYSTGIHPDRIIATSSEKAADQSRAQKGFTIYRVTPQKPMAPGEYAVILYTGEMQGLVGTWFTGTGNSYFDFGVNP